MYSHRSNYDPNEYCFRIRKGYLSFSVGPDSEHLLNNLPYLSRNWPNRLVCYCPVNGQEEFWMQSKIIRCPSEDGLQSTMHLSPAWIVKFLMNPIWLAEHHLTPKAISFNDYHFEKIRGRVDVFKRKDRVKFIDQSVTLAQYFFRRDAKHFRVALAINWCFCCEYSFKLMAFDFPNHHGACTASCLVWHAITPKQTHKHLPRVRYEAPCLSGDCRRNRFTWTA